MLYILLELIITLFRVATVTQFEHLSSLVSVILLFNKASSAYIVYLHYKAARFFLN